VALLLPAAAKPEQSVIYMPCALESLVLSLQDLVQMNGVAGMVCFN